MWCLRMTDNLSTLREHSDLILAKAEQWKNEGGFRHRKPCKEWKMYKKNCNKYNKLSLRYKKKLLNNPSVIISQAQSIRFKLKIKIYSKYNQFLL